MFERFTDRSRMVLVVAQEEARLLNHNFIGTEHLLLGLLRDRDSVAAKALDALGISLEAVREKVVQAIGHGESSPSGSPPFTARSKRVLELALREALQLGHNYIGTEHMLLGLVREGEGVAAQVLVNLGADLPRVRQEVIQRLSGGAGDVDKRTVLSGDLVERTDVPVGAAALLGWDDATALLLAGALLADARTERFEADGIEYEVCSYHPRLPPEISVTVAGAVVTREAFDEHARSSWPDAEHIDGLGDAATYSAGRESLRVLVGSTVFVIDVRRHPHPKDLSITAARRAIANIERSRS